MDNNHIKTLLIEDCPDAERLIREELKDVPYNNIDIEWAKRLSEGLDVIRKRKFDVILLDLSLPDSQGYNTFVKVRVHAPQIPIIVLSGNCDGLLAIKTIRAGAQDFLVKGELDAEVAVRSIHYSIERQRATNELHSMLLIDRLTGLHNRRGLLALGEQQMNISRRDKKGLFIIFVDLINMGDIAIIETANILRKTFRTSDIIGRTDSDKFAVVPIDAHKESTRIMAARLLKNVQTFNTRNNGRFELSIKTCVAHYEQGESISFEELLMRADK